MEDQLVRMVVLEEEYKWTRTERRAVREEALRLNWRHGPRIVFGIDKT